VGFGYKQNFTVRDIRFTKIGIFLHSPAAGFFITMPGLAKKKEQALSHPLSVSLELFYSVRQF
jgi:hypothetical protein